MHREIHDRALFAAAKLAFAASAAVLPACAFPEAPSTDGVAGGEGEPSSTEEGVSKAPAKGKPKPAPRTAKPAATRPAKPTPVVVSVDTALKKRWESSDCQNISL